MPQVQLDRTPLHHHSELLAVGFSHVQAEGVLRARPDEGEDRKRARNRVPIRPYRPPQLPEEGKPADGEAEGEVEESFRFVPAHLSTYTLAGPARHDWQHSVLPGGASGDAEAGVRYSITFREKTLLGSL